MRLQDPVSGNNRGAVRGDDRTVERVQHCACHGTDGVRLRRRVSVKRNQIPHLSDAFRRQAIDDRRVIRVRVSAGKGCNRSNGAAFSLVCHPDAIRCIVTALAPDQYKTRAVFGVECINFLLHGAENGRVCFNCLRLRVRQIC